MKTVLNVLLGLVSVALAYLCVMSILTPIHFEEEKEKREKPVIDLLMDIRKAQIEFKNQKGRYTADFDTLIDFVRNGQIPVVLRVGTLTDEQLKAGLTEAKAVKIVNSGNMRDIKANGLENFRRDTTKISVYASLFGEKKSVTGADSVPAKYKIDELEKMSIIPHSDNVKFIMAASPYTNATSGIVIPLFEAKAPYDAFLGDLDRQQLINLKDKRKELGKYVGLQVGSIDEPNNNAGNWE